jgi:uncharacterized lipoprotein YmbA
MMELRAASMVVSLLTLLTAGCATTQPSRYYMLTATTAVPVESSVIAVSVGPVSVPAVVDRPQIVVTIGPNAVELDEFNHWASTLQDNVSRVVAENLVGMLGTSRVTRFPQMSSADSDYSIAIDVQRFESVPGKSAWLDAAWTVRGIKAGTAQMGRSNVREAVGDDSYQALAAAHSRALARLCHDIADVIAH